MSSLGLGIDFNPPPSPPVNPAVARLQGRGHQRRPLPHAPPLRHAVSLDGLSTAYAERRVRIAHASPEVIGRASASHDDASEDRYLDADDREANDLPHQLPFARLAKSHSYSPHEEEDEEDDGELMEEYRPAPTMQRPRSMMELAHLYAMRAQGQSSPEESSSGHSSSSRSPAQSSMTSISPSDGGSIKMPAYDVDFVPDLPSRRFEDTRPEAGMTDSQASRFVETIVAKPTSRTDLERQGTLLNNASRPSRRERDLNRLLATGATLKRRPSQVVLEQAVGKGKARVELDVVLESALVVEGGSIKGRVEINIRPGDTEVWVSAPKARVVGFEELIAQNTRHVFYHHASVIEAPLGARLPHTSSACDREGFSRGMPGSHSFPFSLHLPIGRGAKGPLKSKHGVVKYIVIGSVKLKAKDGTDRSIAHFYRHIDVYPYFNPAVVLASSLKPISATVDKVLFMGGNGKVHLTASLHRSNWLAGQRCYVDIVVKNETSKRIKSLSFALIRTLSVFRPHDDTDLAGGEPDDSDGNTHRKKVAEEILEMGKRGARGEVTAKGLWMGVDKGQTVEFSHSLQVPAESLTILRGRHIEVSYVLKVGLGAGPLSSDVSVDLPLRIINFISIDPPPGHTVQVEPEQHERVQADAQGARTVPRSWSIDQLRGAATAEASQLSRMASMDSLQLSDLNALYSGQAAMTRAMSATSLEPGTAVDNRQAGPLTGREVYEPTAATNIVERARERQIRHQMSLDCIGSAIASATARRLRPQPSMSALRVMTNAEGNTDDSISDRPLPRIPAHQGAALYHHPGVQLDDLDDDGDGSADGSSDYEDVQRDLEYEDESEDEVDAVLRGFAYDEVVRRGPAVVVAPPMSPPRARATGTAAFRGPASPPTRNAIKSPKFQRLAAPHSPNRHSPVSSSLTAAGPILQGQTRSERQSSPTKTLSPPNRTTTGRVAPLNIRRDPVTSPPSTSPELVPSGQSSPSTEDARTPPSMSGPHIQYDTARSKQLGLLSPPKMTTNAKVAPGVRHRIVALDNRQTALRSVSGRTEQAVSRQDSISSNASSAVFANVHRQAAGTISFKAPMLQRGRAA